MKGPRNEVMIESNAHDVLSLEKRKLDLDLNNNKKKSDRPRQMLCQVHHQALDVAIVRGANVPVEVLRPLL